MTKVKHVWTDEHGDYIEDGDGITIANAVESNFSSMVLDKTGNVISCMLSSPSGHVSLTIKQAYALYKTFEEAKEHGLTELSF